MGEKVPVFEEGEDIPGDVSMFMNSLVTIGIQAKGVHPGELRFIHSDQIIIIPGQEGIVSP